MQDVNEFVQQRIDKLNALKEIGVDVYGRRFNKAQSITGLLKDFKEGAKVETAGRITALREHGKSAFLDLKDSTGKIQIYVKANTIGPDTFNNIFKRLDIGDILGARGELFKTRTGEATINAEEITVLAKGLRPLPEKWHGLKDVEIRYRQRYVDLIVNEDVRKVFQLRSSIISKIRRFLDDKGFLEVETPMMHSLAGGAAGEPFETHHKALDTDLFLRLAPELHLKRLLVGGFDKVYELNRNFRNEGISVRHNPEFTMVEVYEAYSDCEGMMRLTEGLLSHVAKEALGGLKIKFKDQEIDLSTPWPRWSFASEIKKKFDINPDDPAKEWIAKLKKKGVDFKGKDITRSQIVNIISEMLEPETKDKPIFVVDLFAELCPLAKRKKDNPLLTDRFELFIGGMEVANAYSELNDPIEQEKRFKEQLVGQEGVKKIDQDFVRALEYGMPPAGGLGIGIDRLVMLLANQPSIRDVILFPQLKPEK
ncbi:MAG: lysine--tRNA ligase [Candidatus Omnitrophica bacterium]|nr:lysine--tRNA ligase [Candidatus Omnitrophota bacterium]MBU4589823.1 lysine--tRNA ligase [Candidatus Omnitrophota bacterium]